MATVLGWIVGGFGLAVGVWFFLIFLDWIGDWGQDITVEQARIQSRRMHLRWLKEQRQQRGSTAEKP
jgi:hypothetical protein